MSRPPHQVIYTHGGGRLGNQVIRFAHWMAWARAHPGEIEVLNLAFWPHADCFAAWRDRPGCVFPPRPGPADSWARRRATLPRAVRAALEKNSRLARLVQRAATWLPGWQAEERDVLREESLDLDDPAWLARVKRTRTTACCGWKIASWRLVAEQERELREHFRPAP
ncbi:MAG: hypothetical protein JNL39_17285, partial [Opitutaceae bacterium]|nr:hypothetical protein [Opitutaceae bacterium]